MIGRLPGHVIDCSRFVHNRQSIKDPQVGCGSYLLPIAEQVLSCILSRCQSLLESDVASIWTLHGIILRNR